MTIAADLRLGTKPAAVVTEEIIPGLVWGIRCAGNAVRPVDGPIIGPGPGEWIWLHFNLADMRARAWLSECGLAPRPGIARLLDGDEVQQLAPAGDCVAGVFFDLVHDFDRATEEFGLVRFAATEKMLITGRRRALSSVEAVRQRIESGQRYASPAELVAAIVEQIAATIDGTVEALANEIDRVEDTILKEGDPEDRVRLGHARLTSVRVHRRLNALRSLFRRVAASTDTGLMATFRAPAASLTQRLDELDHEVIELRDRSRLLQEELGARVAEQTNRHLRLLAVLTALFLPPTLIAGLLGMNLDGAPFSTSAHGFWIAVAAVVLSSIATLLGLRWAGVFR
ncbi:MAG: cobalt transporter [Bauldia sp.]|nr:cobalt transporter [Bauldia sp.]